ncbi:hypothetical protein SCA6_003110 [Theobroma cacao]
MNLLSCEHHVTIWPRQWFGGHRGEMNNNFNMCVQETPRFNVRVQETHRYMFIKRMSRWHPEMLILETKFQDFTKTSIKPESEKEIPMKAGTKG